MIWKKKDKKISSSEAGVPKYGNIADRCRIFSGSVLKLIAVLSMLIDHTALILLTNFAWAETELFSVGRSFTLYSICRMIGRLAFPIFCFLITEGFAHTRNYKKYAFSLFVFALLSEIPFNLMVGGKFFYPEKQNVYFTLLLGVLLLYVLKYMHSPAKKGMALIALYLIARLLNADYGLNGVLFIGILYYFREQKLLQVLFSVPALSGGIPALCAFIPINMYNGKRGFIQNKILKYCFYLFYPVHMLILLIIEQILL